MAYDRGVLGDRKCLVVFARGSEEHDTFMMEAGIVRGAHTGQVRDEGLVMKQLELEQVEFP